MSSRSGRFGAMTMWRSVVARIKTSVGAMTSCPEAAGDSKNSTEVS